MTIKSNKFKYFKDRFQIPKSGSDTFVVIMPKGISDITSLFEALFNVLLFPGYFGFNWNALSDSLRDFHWLKEKTIVLVHEEIPLLSGDVLKVYFNVLYESITDWKDDKNHVLDVWFPEDYKWRIVDAID